jgi:hypothetical protein
MLGGNAEHLLGDVPDEVLRCPEVRWFLHIVCAALGCLFPWSLWAMTMSFLVIVFTLAWVPHVVFVLHAYVHLAGLAACLGFHMLGLLPWWGLG